MLDSVYRGSPYAALRDLFPDLHPWQMRHAPPDYWDGEAGRGHARAATQQMITQLGLASAPPAEIAQQIDQDTFTRMHLAGMLAVVYGNSPYAALQDVYPDLQPWQMQVVPAGYWQGAGGRTHARAATRWLVVQLRLQDADPTRLREVLDRATFGRLGLRGMLSTVYHNRVSAALADAGFVPS